MIRRRAAVAGLGAAATLAASGQPVAVAMANALTQSRTPSRRVGVEYFGMHFHRLVRKPGEVMGATPWPSDATIGRLRLWDAGTGWADLAPRQGAWNFYRMDAYVSEAQDHGAQILYTLGIPPPWASARPEETGPYGPGTAAEPRRIDDWVDYVRRVSSRYRGVIGAYELWNEPNFSEIERDRGHPGFFSGSVRTMVELARTARSVLSQTDPAALLVTPGFVAGTDRLALFLREGGAPLVDAVAYHFYSRDSAQFAIQVAEVQKTMRDASVAHLPLWNTECGVDTEPPRVADARDAQSMPAELDAAARMAQFVLLGGALGLACFCYYAWDNSRTGMVDANGALLPRQTAYSQLQSWMLDADVTLVPYQSADVIRLAGRRGDDHFILAWAERPAAVDLPVPGGWYVAAIEHLFDRSTPPTPVQCPARARSAHCVLSAVPVRLQLARTGV